MTHFGVEMIYRTQIVKEILFKKRITSATDAAIVNSQKLFFFVIF